MGPDREIPETENQADPNISLKLLLLSLKALSQRALVAFSSLFTFAAVGSAWWLFNESLPTNPSPNQLIGLGLYGAFVLAIHWVRR